MLICTLFVMPCCFADWASSQPEDLHKHINGYINIGICKRAGYNLKITLWLWLDLWNITQTDLICCIIHNRNFICLNVIKINTCFCLFYICTNVPGTNITVSPDNIQISKQHVWPKVKNDMLKCPTKNHVLSLLATSTLSRVLLAPLNFSDFSELVTNR